MCRAGLHLSATIGILVTQAWYKTALVIIAGFLPMFFAAYAYRELNKVVPDCGTSFTWTSKAFGPYVGWIGGWAAILATAIVLSNLAGVAVEFFYQLLGDIFRNPSLGSLWENKAVNVATCVLFWRSPPGSPTGASPPLSGCSFCSSDSS